MEPPRAGRPAPEPVQSDEVRVVAVGTVAWLLALLVLLPFLGRLDAAGRGSWPWICLAGAGQGLVGLVYTRRRSRRAARSGGAGAAR